MDDSDSSSLSFRRKPIVDVFSQRGEFSPLAAARGRSEIPRNTLEFEPRDALFYVGEGCGCKRWYSRHSRLISNVATAIVCITVIVLLIGSLYYHISRAYYKTEKTDNEVPHHTHNLNPDVHIPPKIEIIKEEKKIEESEESDVPIISQPVRHRVVAQVLEDSRELDELPVQNILLPEPNLPSKILAEQLTLAKLRYRRSLPFDYSNRQFKKASDSDCDDTVGATRLDKSVRSKLNSMLTQILDIKKKLYAYEESLRLHTQMPFKDYYFDYPIREEKNYFPAMPNINNVKVSPFHDFATITAITTEHAPLSTVITEAEETTLDLNMENEIEHGTIKTILQDSSENEVINKSTLGTGVNLPTTESYTDYLDIVTTEYGELILNGTSSTDKDIEISTQDTSNVPNSSFIFNSKEETPTNNLDSVSLTTLSEPLVNNTESIKTHTTQSDSVIDRLKSEYDNNNINLSSIPRSDTLNGTLISSGEESMESYDGIFSTVNSSSVERENGTDTNEDIDNSDTADNKEDQLNTEDDVHSTTVVPKTDLKNEDQSSNFIDNDYENNAENSSSNDDMKTDEEEDDYSEENNSNGTKIIITSNKGTNTPISALNASDLNSENYNGSIGTSTVPITASGSLHENISNGTTSIGNSGIEASKTSTTFTLIYSTITTESALNADVFNTENNSTSIGISIVPITASGPLHKDYPVENSGIETSTTSTIASSFVTLKDPKIGTTLEADSVVEATTTPLTPSGRLNVDTSSNETVPTASDFLEADDSVNSGSAELTPVIPTVITIPSSFKALDTTKAIENKTEVSETLKEVILASSARSDKKEVSQKLFDTKSNTFLEEEILGRNKETYSDSEKKIYEVFSTSLEEARNRQHLENNRGKWDSKVVGSSADIKLTTGPDSVVGLGESLKTGQQLSYSPNGFSHFVIPYQMCFYANPSNKGLPTIRNSRSLPPFQIPGFKTDTTTPPVPPQYNFNIVMNNNNPSQQPPPMHMSSPGVLTFPSQQQMARYLNGQQQPLFCSPIQGPLYQFPTVPGTTDFNRAKCINCDDSQRVVSEKNVMYSSAEKDDGPLRCPEGMSRCKDDEQCIPSDNWCDGKVHCSDASDERHCSCKDRVGDLQQCDGYFDCPQGEDEHECFDCPATSFNCGTYDRQDCISLSKRCDGSTDCSNGRDENDCSILAPSLVNASYFVSYDEGFLLRNWRGSWYPVCSENGALTWGQQACSTQLENVGNIEEKDISPAIKGPFLNHRMDGNFNLVHHCKGHVAQYITCPSPKCGTRVWRSASQKATPADEVTRIRRLVEHVNGPVDAIDRQLVTWLDDVKDKVKAHYKLNDVIVKIFPDAIEEGKRSKREKKNIQKRKGDNERVVGGHSSNPNSWPWAVALYKDGHFHCGAVLIDREWVLTAAHCISKFWNSYYEVRIGMLRRFSFSPMEQTRSISHVIQHKNYDYITMKNDLALLRLSEPVIYSKWVRPTCLPSNRLYSREGPWGPAPGTRCIAVGWGAIKEHGMDPNQLREVEVPILNQCKHREDVEGNEICAGVKEGGKDTCQGDSGGALMCRDSSSEESWYVAGIVSHGEGCARPDEPGVYTRVMLYIDWIIENTSGPLPKEVPLQHCPGFQCTSHPKMCITASLRCNGVVNCLEAEDEVGCPLSLFSRSVKSFSNVTSEEEFEPIVQMKREQPHIDVPIFNYSLPFVHQQFKCVTVLQSIPINRRCDGIRDCVDASDEQNCSCGDRLASENQKLVCDGVANCADLSDEKLCYNCPDGYFNCRLSHQCVQSTKKCDRNPDCLFKEDEKNCLATTNDFNLMINEIGEPNYGSKGVIVENYMGVWSVKCFDGIENSINRFASRICRNLDLIGYENVKSEIVNNIVLDVNDGSLDKQYAISYNTSGNCTGCFVTCTERLSEDIDSVSKSSEVVIKMNGVVVCSGALLTTDWILASQLCFDNRTSIENAFIVAELGKEMYPPLAIRIDSVKSISSTDIILLHMESPFPESRLMRPLQIPYYHSIGDLKECLAIGGNKSVKVTLSEDDSSGIIGFRMTRPMRKCRSNSWIGVLQCQSNNGWIPVSVFKEIGGYCGFQRFNYTNILLHLKEINVILDSPVEPTAKVPCDGMRCIGGKCIPRQEICDGWPQCSYKDDEIDLACQEKNSENGSSCLLNQFKCLDGKCIDPGQFNDSIINCMDGSDEPTKPVCASYLQLVAPWRICDGTRNCLDKSDENPSLCTVKKSLNSTDKRWSQCSKDNTTIPSEFLCDGESDCSDSEDERNCLGMERIGRFSNTYEYRNMSYGIWHSNCESAPSLREADDLCKKTGKQMAGNFVKKLLVPKELVLDHFTSVKLNNRTKLAIRGDRPFVSMSLASKPCALTFITCY